MSRAYRLLCSSLLWLSLSTLLWAIRPDRQQLSAYQLNEPSVQEAFRNRVSFVEEAEEHQATVLARLAEFASKDWQLPVPKFTAEFEDQHHCLDVPDAAWGYIDSEAWHNSEDRLKFRRALSQATSNFTQLAMVTMFEASHGDAEGSSQWILRQFACHAQRSDLRPLVFTRSSETEKLVNDNPPLIGVHLPEVLDEVEQFFKLPDDKEMSVYLMKWPMVALTLAEGVSSFLTDVDVAWLRDPRQHLATFQGVDAMVQMDAQFFNLAHPDDNDRVEFWEEKAGNWARGDHVPICCRGAFAYNAGQVLVRSSPFGQALVQNILKFQANGVEHEGCVEEQTPLQWALYENCASDASRCKLLDPTHFMQWTLAKKIRNLEDESMLPFSIHFDTHDKQEVMATQLRAIHDRCV